MNAEDVAKLCESLTLKDKEGPLRPLATGLKDGGEKRPALRLVGKLLSTKSVNRDAFINLIPKIWRIREGVDIEVIDGNTFSFTFRCESDRRLVLQGGPWHFDKALLIHNVPLLCMTSEIAWFLGSIIRDMKEVDDGASGDCIGKYIRVRVVIDVCKPLRRILCVDVLRDGQESTMLLRYERLPEHCSRFGRIGHAVRECSIAANSDGPEDFNTLFGSWLKVNSPVKFGQNCQYKEGVRIGGLSGGLSITITREVDHGGAVMAIMDHKYHDQTVSVDPGVKTAICRYLGEAFGKDNLKQSVSLDSKITNMEVEKVSDMNPLKDNASEVLLTDIGSGGQSCLLNSEKA
ncbi:hypothetical protein EZV62_003222 [Acer yangbiense]|uniref:DUF4283 domain-containing protein n=1 Tax=Acer yangbiense TaxID=1000413 RepID=A0A5C7IG42_9ROSI|nr:hypothetical protein EZV62_003222 [Acer yangbiense]